MAATTRRTPDARGARAPEGPGHPVAEPVRALRRRTTAAQGRLLRFDATERLVHWVTATVVVSLAVTGAALYVPSFGALVGHRLVVEDLHVWAGVAVFLPLLAGAAGPWGRRLRHDLRQVRDLGPAEMDWLRSLGRRGRSALGKFNPGQKLNTNALAGILTVLFATGLLLRWGNFLPVSARTGATFVHDVAAFLLVGLVTAHVGLALAHPKALRSMLLGWVPADWARRHAPAWRAEELSPGGPQRGPADAADEGRHQRPGPHRCRPG